MPWRGVLGLAVLGGLGSLLLAPAAAQPGGPAVTDASADRIELGRELYVTGCSTCHGTDAEGSQLAPSLRGVGAASVDFYLSTGRMPLDRPGAQAVRKPPAYSRRQIDAVVAFVTSLAPGGPGIPQLDRASADLPAGGELWRANCAACHGAAAIGGALAYGTEAPGLGPATAVQVAEAVRIGPGSMPVFGPDTIGDDEVEDITAYVAYLDHPSDRGGSGLGHAGPIAEGFVGLLAGLGLLIAACWWIGERE